MQAPGLVAKYSSRADKELLGLVQKMLVLDPDSRLSAAELLQEPVFASLRNDSQSSKDQQRLSIANSVSESLVEILKVRMRNWIKFDTAALRQRQLISQTGNDEYMLPL